jgi:hypothetical protein
MELRQLALASPAADQAKLRLLALRRRSLAALLPAGRFMNACPTDWTPASYRSK